MTTAQAARLRHQLHAQRDDARTARHERALATLAGIAATTAACFALAGVFSIGGGL